MTASFKFGVLIRYSDSVGAASRALSSVHTLERIVHRC